MTERDETGLDHSTAIVHRPSRAVVVITVLVLVVIVAAVVALPFYAGRAPDASPAIEEIDNAQPHLPALPQAPALPQPGAPPHPGPPLHPGPPPPQ